MDAVERSARATKRDVADVCCARGENRFSARIERRGGRHNVVDQHDVRATHFACPRPGGKRTVNVRGTLTRRQQDLRLSFACPRDRAHADGQVPPGGEGVREDSRLVEATLAVPRGPERNRNQHHALGPRRRIPARDPVGHVARNSRPPAVLQLVNELAARSVRHPAHRARRDNLDGQQRAPLARTEVGRVAAPLAQRPWQGLRPGPARPAHHAALVGEERFAQQAHTREGKVEKRGAEPSRERARNGWNRAELLHLTTRE